jgi:hypothetical protein
MTPTHTPRGSQGASLGQESVPSEHRCLRGARCVAAEVDTESGRRQGAVTMVSTTLCDDCGVRVSPALRDLPRVYIELEMIIDQHRTRPGQKVSGSPEPPIPPRLDVLTAQADIDHELSTWAPPIAHRLGITWNPRQMAAHRPGPRIHRAAHLLALHTTMLLRIGPAMVTDWTYGYQRHTVRTGVEAAGRILDIHRHARLLTTGGPGDSRLPVPCPSCEGTLIRRNGMDHVECQGCPRTWPEHHYRQLCLVLAQDYQDIA